MSDHRSNGTVNGHLAPTRADLVAGRVLGLLAAGQDVDDATFGRVRDQASDPLYGVLDYVRSTVDPAGRRAALDRYCQGGHADSSLIAHVVDAGADMPIELDPGPRPFRLQPIDSATFFAAEYRLAWLAKGILVKDQACVIGGPQKALKTSILIDLAISLSSGRPFLGRFDVPEPMPVLLLSGESGKYVIQRTAKQVCIDRGIPYGDVDVHWEFTLPKVTDPAHLSALAEAIAQCGAKVTCIDPFYLTLGPVADAKSMFAMGPILDDLARTCLDAGSTPILCHHFIKRRENPFSPPETEDLAYSGIGQFMRQWILISRRERYVADSGIHKMHFHYGGSANHSGELLLDIETGRLNDDFSGRRWIVTTASPSEGIATEHEQKKIDQERRQTAKAEIAKAETETKDRLAMREALVKFRAAPDRKLTRRKLRDATGWNDAKAGRVLYRLRDDGYVGLVENAAGSPKTTETYVLVDDACIQ